MVWYAGVEFRRLCLRTYIHTYIQTHVHILGRACDGETETVDMVCKVGVGVQQVGEADLMRSWIKEWENFWAGRSAVNGCEG